MLTDRQLIKQIQSHSPFCCPHTYFRARHSWRIQDISNELAMGYSELRDLNLARKRVENIRCLRCRLKEFFHGL